MKKTRLIVLTVVVMMALFVAVIPTFANHIINDVWSFEKDGNNDGEPDYWDLVGDAYWVCLDRMLYDGYCGVVFPPSDEVAIVYAGMDESGDFVTNEEGVPNFFQILAIAHNLDYGRVFIGELFVLSNGDEILIYSPISGGTWKGHRTLNGIVSNNGQGLMGIYELSGEDITGHYGGVLAMPGSGGILVDWILID